MSNAGMTPGGVLSNLHRNANRTHTRILEAGLRRRERLPRGRLVARRYVGKDVQHKRYGIGFAALVASALFVRVQS